MQYIDRDVGELSRGTKQKIALCRALINEPKLLLLDEPSAFLDPVASRMLHNELNALSRSGVSIVYATQRLDELYRIGDNVLLLKKGRMIALGSVEKILNGLGEIEVEIITSKPMQKARLQRCEEMEATAGESEKSLIFSLKRINEIPNVVRDVVKNNGEIISVLYLKESIDRLLEVMTMKYSHVAAIAMKDMKEAFSSLSIYGPMIGIPLFFAIALPIFTIYISQYAGAALFTKVLGISVSISIGICGAGNNSYSSASSP